MKTQTITGYDISEVLENVSSFLKTYVSDKGLVNITVVPYGEFEFIATVNYF